MCQRCVALEAQNKKLLGLVKLAGRIIKSQDKQLEAARLYTWKVITEFQRLQANGGVPRSEFHRWQGRAEVATYLYKVILIFDWSSAFWKMVGRMKGL